MHLFQRFRSNYYNAISFLCFSKGFDWSTEEDFDISPATCCGFLEKRGCKLFHEIQTLYLGSNICF